MPNEVYFNNISGKIADVLNAAKSCIHLAVAWLTDDELFNVLCKKARQGLIVNVICQKDEINAKSGIDYSELIGAGGQIFFISPHDDYVHHKFCVIDNDLVLTGSYNWTRMAAYNSENIVFIRNERSVSTAFLSEFYRLFEPDCVDTTKLIRETELGATAAKAVEVNLPESVLTELMNLLIKRK